MNENQNDIVLTLASLYEILLQIGKSFDIKENAQSFLKTLMLQQNLSFAGYYSFVNSVTLKKVFSIPKTKFGAKAVNPEWLGIFSKNDLIILDNSNKEYQYFNFLFDSAYSKLAVFRGGDKSILVLGIKSQQLSFTQLNAYTLVFKKFCFFMESLESHNQINHEISIKNEQAKTIQKNNLQLEKQNEELRKYINSNNELEKFAYRTSHDLKAPLKSLSSFTKLLALNSELNLTDIQLKYLKIIDDSGQQMDLLIDGILEYSRFNESQVKKQKVNIQGLLEQVELMLFDNISSVRAQIKKKDLPNSIWGDETKLKQLFLNLISNALKFRRSDVLPIITITCAESTAEYLFSVQDNGIGMKQENTDKIFKVFERLNSDQFYEGSGIGLSTCKQIVIQHNGRIWVDSTLHKGSTFYFTISSH